MQDASLTESQQDTTTSPSSPSSSSASGGRQSVRGALRQADGFDAQAALLEPVQRRARSVGQGRGAQAGAVQLRAVQMEEAPVATPHADAALEQVGAGTGGAETTSPAEQAPTITVPQSYDAYVAHIENKFAGDIAHLRQLQQTFASKTQESEVQATKVDAKKAELKQLAEKYKAKKDSLSDEESARKRALELMQPFEGMTMAKLHEEATGLLAKHKNAKIEDKADLNALEGIMYATLELMKDIDPESSGFGRELYSVKIDEVENAALVTKAAAEGMPPAQVAELSVNYRTWARVWMRTVIMNNNQVAAENLFLRDLGRSGREAGESPQTILSKIFAKKKEKWGFDEDLTFDEATEEQKLKVYEGMIESAQKTNAGANAGLMGPSNHSTNNTTETGPGGNTGGAGPTGGGGNTGQ